ncbi:MAG: hypothetical protein GMKNLPBB_02081 [Myxococcota bacterium]|nr:hypothetical protein [Myxococcota bacterium]
MIEKAAGRAGWALAAVMVIGACAGAPPRREDRPPTIAGILQEIGEPAVVSAVLRQLPAGAAPDAPFLASIHELSVANAGARALNGVNMLPHLEILDASGNEIDDLTPLSGLKKLRRLSLWSNRLTSADLHALAGLPALEVLDLGGNQLNGLSGLPSPSALQVLSLAGNHVKDLRDLQPLPGLRRLVLDDNALTSLAGVERFPALELLSVKGNRISDLSALSAYPQLGAHLTINLKGNPFQCHDQRDVLASVIQKDVSIAMDCP